MCSSSNEGSRKTPEHCFQLCIHDKQVYMVTKRVHESAMHSHLAAGLTVLKGPLHTRLLAKTSTMMARRQPSVILYLYITTPTRSVHPDMTRIPWVTCIAQG